MILNTHSENRKAMVKAICELTGMNAMYLFTPTYAYQVGPVTVSRDGTIDCEDETMLSTIKPMLIKRGWLQTEETSESFADSKRQRLSADDGKAADALRAAVCRRDGRRQPGRVGGRGLRRGPGGAVSL